LRAPALVAVADPPAAFAALFAAARARGERIGWLDWSEQPSEGGALDAAAALGALRAVAVGAGRTVAVKRLAGAPVLRDLVREHFLGCGLVLIRGGDGVPSIAPVGAGFRVETAPGRARELPAEEALAELLRPRHRPPPKRDRP
jgi:hypothetical protein